jgi:hypothetical protein
MDDPTVSGALKTVLTAWRSRDWIDAAEDARLLARVFDAEVDRALRRLLWPSR